MYLDILLEIQFTWMQVAISKYRGTLSSLKTLIPMGEILIARKNFIEQFAVTLCRPKKKIVLA